jgi:hypothetical protein
MNVVSRQMRANLDIASEAGQEIHGHHSGEKEPDASHGYFQFRF